MSRCFATLVFLALTPSISYGQQSANLLSNSAAEDGLDAWRSKGQAAVEEFDGNRCFVVRNGGSLQQVVNLPPGSAGKFALFIARVAGERAAWDITDRPYLYGLTVHADRHRILQYNQAPTMRGSGDQPNLWSKAWGIFVIPEGASTIAYQLGQGLRRGVPHTGAAARFDDVGLFVFDNRSQAEAFMLRYR